MVPLYYAYVAQDLANALAERGDQAHASEVIGLAQQVVQVAQ
jgi:hypothetical protein